VHPSLYSRFERLFHEYPPAGNEILEIGATPNMFETLLTPFKKIFETYHYIGITIKANSVDNLPYTLIQCNDFPVLHLECMLEPVRIIAVAEKPSGKKL